ncbi:DEAD/DEAH box helicase [Cohnella sp. GCM10027633]|uniref:DEAD/DEAH box helicase n=1 Tax=unclassified Cohnella TaxID=2636738 RepID=UPI00363A6938
MTTRSFRDYTLSEEILRALENLGYKEPTDVQEKVIPLALEGKDIAVKSRTGSGKTAAFGIPVCENALWEENKPQALVLAPTRELALQVSEDMTNIGRFKRIKSAAIFGKDPFAKQAALLKQKTHVVVGTPGRVLDHIGRGTIDLSNIRYLVIDEADEMLNMGFIEQVESILQALPKERTTLLFSATLPKDVEKLCHQYMRNPIDIEISTPGGGAQNNLIDHSLIATAKDADKPKLLRDVLVVENPDSAIIFGRTQESVDLVYRQLDTIGLRCGKIHGGMEQEDRIKVMNAFRRGEFRYLVATDVAARGIDIDSITHVINYDMPQDNESYVHRSGRTGRAGKEGKAISFALPSEDKFLASIERYVGFEIRKRKAPSSDEVQLRQPSFEKKVTTQPTIKKDKNAQLNQGITKLYFGGGKKKKLRPVDFVGTLSNLPGMSADDIGIIAIQELESYVDILNGKGKLVLEAMKSTTVKGKLLKVYVANK